MGRMVAREDIPVATPGRERDGGEETVTLPALTSAKVELYRLMRSVGVGKAELARRLGVALPQVDRLLDLRHNSRLDAMERAFAALGHAMDLHIRKVA